MSAGGAGPTGVDVHAADAHHIGGGHDHAHDGGHDHDDPIASGHDGESLGPIDWQAWGAAALGVGVSVVIAACFYVAGNSG